MPSNARRRAGGRATFGTVTIHVGEFAANRRSHLRYYGLRRDSEYIDRRVIFARYFVRLRVTARGFSEFLIERAYEINRDTARARDRRERRQRYRKVCVCVCV